MQGGHSRRLAAILAADIAGYSALMGADEARTVTDLKGHQAVILPMVAQFGGRIIDTAGDGILAEFASIVNAVECAVAIQEKMSERNADVELQRRMKFRMGINLGDVIYDDDRIFGDGINVAARLENIAEPGGICISGKVHDEIRSKMNLLYEDLGDCVLKNIANPVRVYNIRLSGAAARRTRVAPNTISAQNLWLRSTVRFLIVPFVLLLVIHHLAVNVLDLDIKYLRSACIIVPLACGFIIFWSDGRHAGYALGFAVALGVITVAGMTASQSLSSGDPVIPQTRYEWWDNVNFAAMIILSFVAGHLVARVLWAVRYRSQRR